MKSQYILAVFLLIGFGVVTSMAFELNTPAVEIPEAYALDTSSTDATLSNVKIRPSKQGNAIIVKVDLAGIDGNNYVIGIEFESEAGGFYDLSGVTIITPTGVYETGNSILFGGYLEGRYMLSGSSETLTLRVEKSEIWAEVDSIMITLADDI